ncbi:alcohol dehydrogenase catalytic domain-containing protein [Nonomuraea angiospora]|uniref:MmyB family transcriptional regulator n=1 Tax=Nonomuraea angiospora TaxID=46172 RepID=UPI003EBF818C
MRQVVMHTAGDVRVEEREDPRIVEPTDAIIRLTATCICGSDLWPYRGVEPADQQVMGHEYVGVVEEIGADVKNVKVGAFVVGSFVISDNTCEIRRSGYQSQCVHGSFVAQTIGTQSERARIPYADGTLVPTPGRPDPELIPSLLAASDVLGTGWFGAVAAEAGPGKTVAVVGDGAVGLMGVLAAKQLGAERIIHLFDLARPTPTTPAARSRRRARPSVRASVQRVLGKLAVPAVVVNAQQDLIAANPMGRALFAPHFEAEEPNLARFIFLDPRARDFYVDWPLARSMTAAMLRLEAGRDPLNQELTAHIGELSTLSPQFRADWAERDVHEHRTGRKVYRHPEVGEIDVTFDVFELPGEPGLSICAYSVEEGSPSAGRFALLSSWAATQGFGSRQRVTAAHGEEPAGRTEPIPFDKRGTFFTNGMA